MDFSDGEAKVGREVYLKKNQITEVKWKKTTPAKTTLVKFYYFV